MPCYRTTTHLARGHAEGYAQVMGESGFVGRITRTAYYIPIWQLEPQDSYRIPATWLWESKRSSRNAKRIMKAMLRCKPLPPVVVEPLRRGNRTWQLIDGHHRASVAAWLGLTHVPALISDERYSY